MPKVPPKTIFLNIGKKRKEKITIRSMMEDGMVNRKKIKYLALSSMRKD